MKRITFILLSGTIGILSLALITAVLNHNEKAILLAKGEAQSYTIIDLGTLGGSESEAAALNEAIQIVGSSTISTEEGLTAFLWQEGNMTSLAETGILSSQALAINDEGTIVGTGVTGSGESADQRPLLWNGGDAVLLPTVEDAPGIAQAINNQGLIAGSTLAESDNHLLIWQGENISETIPISGGVGWANDINIAGQLVGAIEDDQGGSLAYLYQAGTFTNLGTLGGSSSAAYAVNDAAQIVGSASISDDLGSHAFLWEDGLMQDLGGLDKALAATSKANDINNPGIVVGQAQLGEAERAVMWQEGQIIDLNSFLPPDSEWDLLISAVSINDQGWIAGTGLIDGQKRAFLLQPLLHRGYLPVVARPNNTPTPSPTPTSTPTATPVPSGVLDMEDFMVGSGILYEVWQSKDNSQARFQTQEDSIRFFHTKGNEIKAEWEELWIQNGIVYRGTDTSPGEDEDTKEELYYTLYAYKGSKPGSAWSPRYWKVGDYYKRSPYLVFFRKSDCHPLYDAYPETYLHFVAFHESYTFESGITLKNVIELDWLERPGVPFWEKYFYAKGYGLVGWRSSTEDWRSFISEIHAPGARPDNTREVISCLGSLNQPFIPDRELPPVPEELLRRVK